MSLDGEMSKLDLCPASVHKADKKNLLVALFRIVPTPQHTSEPTMVSATPRNTEVIAGLPRARSARGTDPHTHRLRSTSFRLVVT